MKYLILLCSIILSHFSYAQPMYSIGTNTGANSIPLGAGTWADQRCQFLYIPSEYATVPPGLITKIYFRYGGTSATTDTKIYTNFRVDIGQNMTTSLSATAWETGLTTVLSVPSFSVPPTPVNGWIEIPLTTPIFFDPTKSLVIDTRQTATTSVAPALALRNQTAVGNRRAYAASAAAAPGSAGTVRYDLGFDLITCLNPSNLAVSNLTKTSAKLTWDAIPSSLGYEYVFNQDPSDPTIAGTTTTTPSYTPNDLTPGATYYFHLRTKCTAANSPYITISFTTPICSSVNDLTISGITENKAQFDWTTIPVADKYEYLLTTGSTVPTSSAGTIPTTSITASANGLIPNTLYNLFIRSRCWVADSSIWKQYSFSTFTECLPPVLEASQVERNQWKISWPENTAAVAYEYALSGINTPMIGNTIYTNNITVGIPDDGEPYYIYARSKCYNIYNVSPWGRVELRTPLSIANTDNTVDIDLYPNPVRDRFTLIVNGTLHKGAVISITDISGKVIMKRSIESNKYEIDLSQQSPGTYFLKYVDTYHSQLLKINKL